MASISDRNPNHNNISTTVTEKISGSKTGKVLAEKISASKTGKESLGILGKFAAVMFTVPVNALGEDATKAVVAGRVVAGIIKLAAAGAVGFFLAPLVPVTAAIAAGGVTVAAIISGALFVFGCCSGHLSVGFLTGSLPWAGLAAFAIAPMLPTIALAGWAIGDFCVAAHEADSIKDSQKMTAQDKSTPSVKTSTQQKETTPGQEDLDAGRKFMRNKEYDKAVDCFSKAEKQGNGEAMLQLGFIYEKGLSGSEKDDAKAVEYYKRAVEKNVPLAMNKLALLYLRTSKIQGNNNLNKEAIKLYESAVKENNAPAMRYLASCYYTGIGVEKDLEKSIELYEQAAGQGDVTAAREVGFFYEHGMGGKIDLNKAEKFYEQAAGLGDRQAFEALNRVRKEKSGSIEQ